MAQRLNRIGEDVTRRQRDLLHALGLPVEMPDVNHDDLLDVMRRDKKVEHGRLRFVLPTRLGHVELVGDVDASSTSSQRRYLPSSDQIPAISGRE